MSIKKSPLAIVVGTTLFSGLAVTAVQAAEFVGVENDPFALTELANGYMQVAQADKSKQGDTKMKAGACGEGKCGASMTPPGALEKTAEGKCAGNKPVPAEKKADAKATEGKCGEGKCGSSMQ